MIWLELAGTFVLGGIAALLVVGFLMNFDR